MLELNQYFMLNFILTIDNLLITSKIKPILHYAVSYKSIKMIKDKTLVIGASDRNDKYSNIATRLLLHKGYEVKTIGSRAGFIGQTEILTEMIPWEDIHTITLYINPEIQKKYYEYILKLKPKRILFNPGTENDELRKLAESAGIETEFACTLVLLNLNQY